MSNEPTQQPDPIDNGEHRDSPSSMDVAAIELNEMYSSLCRGGFNPREALYLIGQAVAAGFLLTPEFNDPTDLEDLIFGIGDIELDIDDDEPPPDV